MEVNAPRVLAFGATLILLQLLNAYWVKARARSAVGEEGLLRYPTAMLYGGVALTALTGGFAVVAALRGAGGFTSAALFGIAGLCSLFILESRVKHELFGGGMRYGKLLGGGTLFWVDVKELRYSRAAKWFTLTLSDGTTARISVMFTSLPAFATAALLHVPPSSIDDATRRVLADTAAGAPPSIWET